MPKRKEAPLPFHKDLGGYERINKSMARKLWSWGLPVQADAGRGAKPVPRPKAAPVKDNAVGAFRDACSEAEPACREERKWKNTIFLAPYGPMCLHLGFKDGSNPFVKYGTHMELYYELRAWEQQYAMETEKADSDRIAAFLLEDRAAWTPVF